MPLIGLDSVRAFNLELAALLRLKNQSHMCQLVDYDKSRLTLNLQWAGIEIRSYYKSLKRSLKGTEQPKDIGGKISHADLVDQLNCIYTIFEKLDIVHLDLTKPGKNVCCDISNITVIDFNITVLDRDPMSPELATVYKQFIAQGGLARQHDQLLADLKPLCI